MRYKLSIRMSVSLWLLIGLTGCQLPTRDASKDLEQIRIAVLRDHVSMWIRRVGLSSETMIFFLDTRSERETSVLGMLSTTQVLVVCGTNGMVYGDRAAVLDKRSRRPAVLFAAEVESINSDETSVRSSASRTDLAGEFYRYILRRKEGSSAEDYIKQLEKIRKKYE